ncbi:Uncharacterised protein [Legionella beliardensis]|uniref:Inverse autotransporter beta-domain domain-containing protein n=1 Tax=Legionella beliardensis TaxID=91822 RepID=A0A378HZZ3_9GAMM|nr:hypothetical protein [Legionella beliardensis]STX28489.1 Uncharacterised protein [Legionella beliardensis]
MHLWKGAFIESTVCCLLCLACSAKAATLTDFLELKHVARASLSGGASAFEGSSSGLGLADILMPLSASNMHNLFSNFDAKVGQEGSYGLSAGLGFREVRVGGIIGLYTFADFSKTTLNHDAIVFNPGLEWLGHTVDFHLNAYVPANRQTSLIKYGPNHRTVTQTISHFNSRQEYSYTSSYFEAVGPGADVILGNTFANFHYVRPYIGAYYYSPEKMHTIDGVQGGINIPMTSRLTLKLADSYDNVHHNTVFLGLTLQLGGVSPTAKTNLSDRLSDEIPRHLGTLNTGSFIPSERAWFKTSQDVLTRDNVWFFSGTAGDTSFVTPMSCTYEHPCYSTQFNQANLNLISQYTLDPKLYLEQGLFDISANNHYLFILSGQSIYGRTLAFRAPAPLGNQPIINGTLELQGNNTLANLTLDGTSARQPIGIVAGHALSPVSTLAINAVEVRNFTGNNTRAGYGMNLVGTNIRVTNSRVNNIGSGVNIDEPLVGQVYGIAGQNVGDGYFNLVGNTVEALSTTDAQEYHALYGISVINEQSGSMTIAKNTITDFNPTINTAMYGLWGENQTVGLINFNQNTLANLTGALNGGQNQSLYGLMVFNNGQGHVVVRNNAIANLVSGNATNSTTTNGININNQVGSARIESNTITALLGGSSQTDEVNGINLANYGGQAYVNNNIVDNIAAGDGLTEGGVASGIQLSQIYGTLTAQANTIINVSGGNNAIGGNAMGIQARGEFGGRIRLIQNTINQVAGGNGGGIGGNGIGIFALNDYNDGLDNTTMLIAQNNVSAIYGGTGNNIGSDAVGIEAINSGDNVAINNNTITLVQGGNSNERGGNAFGIYGYQFYSDIFETNNSVDNVAAGQGTIIGFEEDIRITYPPF